MSSINGVQRVLRSHVTATGPRVSVVITTRNHGRMLAAAVRAVMAQSLDDEIEAIICDNASTDATETVSEALVAEASRPLTYVRLATDLGPAGGRNVGIELARGQFVAFTDSDCVPAHTWLAAGLAAFRSDRIGVVQGRTIPEQLRVPLLEHHIAIDRFDGTFATANVIYRRQALGDLRFDPKCWYWEDVDLGWRVTGRGWEAAFAGSAVVAHQIIPVGALRWVLWPRRHATLPAIARRYPGFRRHLFLGVWARSINLWCELALLGVLLFPWSPFALILVGPYAVAFARTRAMRGRLPVAKAMLHAMRDVVSVVSLAMSSARHRSLVL